MQDSASMYANNPLAQHIETCEGRKFFLSSPDFRPTEIGHALSNMCRYTGHCRTFYSVAEHSVLVARIMDALDLGDPFEGLMHDATESILADMASPWKSLMPEYRTIEHKLDRALREQFGLEISITDGCKRADWAALMFEAEQLMPTKGVSWLCPAGTWDDVAVFKRMSRMMFGDEIKLGAPPELAKRMWLREFATLNYKRSQTV